MESIIAAIISLISKFVGNDKGSNQGGTTIIHNHNYGDGGKPAPTPQPTPQPEPNPKDSCLGIGCLTLIVLFVIGTCLRQKEKELPIPNSTTSNDKTSNKPLSNEDMIIGTWDYQFGWTDGFNQHLLVSDSLCLVFNKNGSVIKKQFSKNGTVVQINGAWKFNSQVFSATFDDGENISSNYGNMVKQRQLKGKYRINRGNLKGYLDFVAIRNDLMKEEERSWELIGDFLHNEEHIERKKGQEAIHRQGGH